MCNLRKNQRKNALENVLGVEVSECTRPNECVSFQRKMRFSRVELLLGPCTNAKRVYGQKGVKEKSAWVNWFIYTRSCYDISEYFYKHVLCPIVCLCAAIFFRIRLFKDNRMFVTPYKDAAFSFRAFVFLDVCRRAVGYNTRIANIIYWPRVFINRSRLKFIQKFAFVIVDSYPHDVDFTNCKLKKLHKYQ